MAATIENRLLQAALDYAARGWPVFPLYEATKDHKCSCGNLKCEHPGKHPRTPHGKNDATTNKGAIIQWWKNWPNANIGVLTGEESGIVVLDVDKDKGGFDSFKKLCQKGNMPYTLEVSSGGGGAHYYMVWPNNGTRLKSRPLEGYPGIDIKGDKGSIIAPPSKHISGDRYSWSVGPLGVKVSNVPEWLLKIAGTDRARVSMIPLATSYWQKVWSGVSENRNVTATKLAGRLIGRGIQVEEAQTLLELWNQQNNPPLSDSELTTVIRSISKIEEGKPDKGAIMGADWLLSQPAEAMKEIITKGLLQEDGGMIISAEGGAGKSILSLEWAVRLAKGMNIFDFEVPKERRVLIIQKENPMSQVRYRLEKICYGLKVSSVPNLFLVEKTFKADVLQERDRRKLIERIEKVRAEVVILDPLISYHSAGENDNVKMRAVLDSLTDIAVQTGAAWIIIHHFGKPGDTPKESKWQFRGATAIRDWARTMISMTIKYDKEKGRELRILNFDKINFGPRQPSLMLERNQFFVHENVEENTLVPMSLVADLLSDLGGTCRGKSPLVKKICDLIHCSQRTAYNAIDDAIGRVIDEVGGSLKLICKV
ncbi:MAG: bifunctional DNA primase/polymerase [Thermodesulfobacteriota bacterium]